MVMARIHIICGNCGCNDQFELEIERDVLYDDDNDLRRDEANLYCKNCSTIHFLTQDYPAKTKIKR